MKKWGGSGGIDKLDAYVPQPSAQSLRNIKTHLMFLSFLIWPRNISHYVPRGFDVAEEHKDSAS
jgi:hypothetical protein